MTTKTAPTTKTPTFDQEHLDGLPTTAAKIRYLVNTVGMSRWDTSKILGIKYQWVRNVMVTPVKNPKS